MKIGYKLAAEAYGPAELVRQAVAAEQAGFDFVEISDHFHPWLDAQGHSPFAWSVLGAIAARTERLGLATGVTCPTVRYHPAVIAQAAATTALLSEGRFTLGLGAGERLNERVVGPGFADDVTVRHAMLREAIEIIRILWRGDYRTYYGEHFTVTHAQIFDLPDEPIPIAVAGGGPSAARLAGALGDGLFTTEPDADLVERFRAAGGMGPCYAEIPVSYAADVDTAVEAAWQGARWAVTGWKVMAELPDPAAFAAASATVRREDVAEAFACGADPQLFLDAAAPYLDAGYDHPVLMNVGPDPEAFIDFAGRELLPRLRQG